MNYIKHENKLLSNSGLSRESESQSLLGRGIAGNVLRP